MYNLIHFETHIITWNSSDGIFRLEADTGSCLAGGNLRKHTHRHTHAHVHTQNHTAQITRTTAHCCAHNLSPPKGNETASWKTALVLCLGNQLLPSHPQPLFPAGIQNQGGSPDESQQTKPTFLIISIFSPSKWLIPEYVPFSVTPEATCNYRKENTMSMRLRCVLLTWTFYPIGDFRKTDGKLSSQMSQKIV